MAIKVKATIDGQEREIELSAPPPGFLPEDQIGTRVEAIVGERIGRAKQSARKELLEDEAFVSEVLKKHGAKGGEGKSKLGEDEIAKLREAWEAEKVKPLSEQLKQTSTEAEALRRDKLRGDILAAAAKLGVKAPFLNAPSDETPAPIVAWLESVFGYDAKSRTWAVKQGDGYAFSGKATSARPYKGVEEFLAEWAQNPANAEFINAPSQGGPGMGKPSGSKGNTVSISRADARIKSKWDAAMKAAREAGQEAPTITD